MKTTQLIVFQESGGMPALFIYPIMIIKYSSKWAKVFSSILNIAFEVWVLLILLQRNVDKQRQGMA